MSGAVTSLEYLLQFYLHDRKRRGPGTDDAKGQAARVSCLSLLAFELGLCSVSAHPGFVDLSLVSWR